MLAEFPNDMNMLAYLGGELTNAAKYFSTFADISSDKLCEVNHSAQNNTMISDHGNIIGDWLLLRKLLTLRVN